MPVRKLLLLLAGAVCAIATTAPAAFALGIGISTPTVTLTNFGPNLTATGTGTLAITGVLAPWTLQAADPSHGGHLVPAAIGCSGVESQTVNALSARASGVLPSTQSAGTVVIGASPQTVATGSAIDTVNVNYSLAIGSTELMRAGCVFSTTVTFTVQ